MLLQIIFHCERWTLYLVISFGKKKVVRDVICRVKKDILYIFSKSRSHRITSLIKDTDESRINDIRVRIMEVIDTFFNVIRVSYGTQLKKKWSVIKTQKSLERQKYSLNVDLVSFDRRRANFFSINFLSQMERRSWDDIFH